MVRVQYTNNNNLFFNQEKPHHSKEKALTKFLGALGFSVLVTPMFLASGNLGGLLLTGAAFTSAAIAGVKAISEIIEDHVSQEQQVIYQLNF